MRPPSERLGAWLPVVLAAALPTAFIPNLVDAFILPRASVAIAGACVGTGLALLIPRKPTLGGLRMPVIAAVAAAILAFAFSVSWPLSLVGGYTRYESLPMRLAYLGLLAVPVWLLRSELARTLVVAALVLGTTVSSAEAIFQFLLALPFRPDGNLGNANLLGALIAISLPLTLSQMFRPGWQAPAWWAAAAIMTGGLIVSTSRGGAVAAIAGCAAVVVFSLRGRVAAIASVGAVVLVAAALLLILLSPLRDLNGDPGPTRIHLYHDAVQMVLTRPITGWGEDATGLVFGRFLTGDWSPGVTFDRVHSGPLDLTATEGLLGVAALGWVLVVLFRGFWKWRFAPEPGASTSPIGSVTVGSIAAACVAYSVWVVFNFDWAPATAVFWLLAGTGWSAVQAAEASRADPIRVSSAAWSSSQYGQRVLGAMALVAVAVFFAALPVLGEAWYAQGRPDLATHADPFQSQYHRALGESLIAQGSTSEGLEELKLAAKLGATDPALYVELGDEELKAGDAAQARADYQMALTIDPYWAPAQRRLSGSSGVGTA